MLLPFQGVGNGNKRVTPGCRFACPGLGAFGLSARSTLTDGIAPRLSARAYAHSALRPPPTNGIPPRNSTRGHTPPRFTPPPNNGIPMHNSTRGHTPPRFTLSPNNGILPHDCPPGQPLLPNAPMPQNAPLVLHGGICAYTRHTHCGNPSRECHSAKNGLKAQPAHSQGQRSG